MAKKKPLQNRSIADHITDSIDRGDSRGGIPFPGLFSAEAQEWFYESRRQYHAELNTKFNNMTAFVRFLLAAAKEEFPKEIHILPSVECVRRWLKKEQ
jgi:hypothetical protein